MAHRSGGPPPGVSLLDYYGRPPQPSPTYHFLNAIASGQTTLPRPVDYVDGGCFAGDSDRNRETIFKFITGEGNDDLRIVVFLAGHSGMINPHQSAGEPKSPIGCYTWYFNYAGESTYANTDSATTVSDKFMSLLNQAASTHTFDKKMFFEFIQAFKQQNIVSDAPLSLYEPSTQMDDSNVLTNGGVSIDDTYVNHLGQRIFRRNPASALMFVKQANGPKIYDLTKSNPAIIDMGEQTRGDLKIHPTADGSGFEHDYAPYVYRNTDGTYRYVKLSDIYDLIKVAIKTMGLVNPIDENAMNEFMHRHVVLVSLGCRSLGNGTVYRVESVPRAHSVSPEHATGSYMDQFPDPRMVADVHERGFLHWPLPTPGSGSSVSVPPNGGKKKKQRRRQTRNRNKKRLSKKRSTKRSRI